MYYVQALGRFAAGLHALVAEREQTELRSGVSADGSTKVSLLRRVRRDPGLLFLLFLMLISLPAVTQRIYASDEIKYYAYLHSIFFDGDLDFTNDYTYWKDLDEAKYGPLVDSMLKPNPNTGLPINEAPLGSALLWSPFYLLAHLFATVSRALGSNVAANGFSQPYISAVCYASFFYGWAGLLLGYAILRRLFQPFAAALAIAAAWLATPAVFYMVIAPPWSHGASLFAVSLFMFLWFRTRPATRRTPLQWATLGLSAGLMMLVREQDALFLSILAVETLLLLIPRFAGRAERPVYATASSVKPAPVVPFSLVERLRSLVVGWVILASCAVLAFAPQLLVYRITNGTFRPSSTVSEKLTWWSPHFFEVLFSPRYGLITWTPLVLIALFGLFFLARKDLALALSFLVAVFAQVFVAGAFLTWMGASSFGQRRFINLTIILAFGVAALIAWLLSRGLAHWQIAGLAGLLVLWNAGLIMQYSAGPPFWTSDDREYGLRWPQVLGDQYRVYARLPEYIWRFIFDRKSFQNPNAT